MLKSIYISIFIVLYLIKMIDNQLILRPTDTVILRDQFKPFIALCTGQGNTRVVTWRSPSYIDIEENSRNRITVERKSSGLRLRIRNLTQNDQGTWTCLGFNEYGQSISKTYQINVKIPITFMSESIQYAELDSTVLIKCQVNENPSAEISWFKGRDKINILSSNYEQRDDGLKINRVSLIDNDIFWCQADIIETGESKDYQIQVIIAQPITSTKITCLPPCAVEKRTATLICETNGMPTPEYIWSYGQNSPFMVNGISKYVIRENRLIINYVDETDNGRYICHAFNDYDKKGQKAEYILNVIIPPVVLPIPPIEISIDEHYSSQRVSFACRIGRGSVENLSFEWLYANNTPVQPINGISIDTSFHLTELIFYPVRREHHGNYTCLVKNSADTILTVTRLLVQYKPIFIGPMINEVYSVPNHRVIMKCQFDSYPSSVIQWIKILEEHNQMILEDNDPRVIEISTKEIGSTIHETQLTYNPSEEDFNSKFECRADNSRIEKHFLTLRHAKPPGQVHIPEIKPSSNTIELNVVPSSEFGGLPLLQYIVEYQRTDVNDSLKTEFFPVLFNGSELIEIKSLRAASPYRIRVAVESQAGRSVFSRPVQAKTLDGQVPQFSLSNNSCVNNISCLIKWSIEYDGGSPISQIQIIYAKIHRNGKEEKGNKPININANMTEYKLIGLKPNTNYSITVRLSNVAGYGERKIRITTGSIYRSKGNSPPTPSIGIIIAIIISIIIGTILVFLILVLNQVRRKPNNQPDDE